MGGKRKGKKRVSPAKARTAGAMPRGEAASTEKPTEDLEFEDAFEDEWEDEEVVKEGDWEDMGDVEEDEAMETSAPPQQQVYVPWGAGASSSSASSSAATALPAEQLEVQQNAYDMLHRLTMEAPCLSLDVLIDAKNGLRRTKYPHTIYMVTGSQQGGPSASDGNALYLLKASDLYRTKYDDDEDPSDDDVDGLDDDPVLEFRRAAHPGGGCLRVRACPHWPTLVASWSEGGGVHVWDVAEHLEALDMPPKRILPVLAPTFTFDGHTAEGFAMAWSPVPLAADQFRFASGDTNGAIHVWTIGSGGFHVGAQPLQGHEGSVEDLAWCPDAAQGHVLASCGIDHTVRFWDTRTGDALGSFVAAPACDVNVMAWNALDARFLLTGADDGSIAVWNVADVAAVEQVALFKLHRNPISSVMWCPHDMSTFAACDDGEQSVLTVWDMSVERDEEAEEGVQGAELPPQLMFVHMGQAYMKELAWHPLIPGALVCTAYNGIHVFKPSNLDASTLGAQPQQ